MKTALCAIAAIAISSAVAGAQPVPSLTSAGTRSACISTPTTSIDPASGLTVVSMHELCTTGEIDSYNVACTYTPTSTLNPMTGVTEVDMHPSCIASGVRPTVSSKTPGSITIHCTHIPALVYDTLIGMNIVEDRGSCAKAR